MSSIHNSAFEIQMKNKFAKILETWKRGERNKFDELKKHDEVIGDQYMEKKL